MSGIFRAAGGEVFCQLLEEAGEARPAGSPTALQPKTLLS